jgi:hypothetical protein
MDRSGHIGSTSPHNGILDFHVSISLQLFLNDRFGAHDGIFLWSVDGYF